MFRLTRLTLCFVIGLAAVTPASAGWVLERVTHTEGQPGPSSKITLWIAGGRVKELHDDGTYFLWDVPRGLLFRVDPVRRTYSGGDVSKMIADVRAYLDDLRERLEALTPEEREELADRNPGMPLPVPPPKTPVTWTVRATTRSQTIAGHRARLFEILRDGVLFAERWIGEGFSFGDDLDYVRFSRWSRELEGSFAVGMGGAAPEGEAVEALEKAGVELRSVLLGEGVRVVSEVKRLEAAEVPPATFTLPPGYLPEGAQLSRRGGRVTSSGE